MVGEVKRSHRPGSFFVPDHFVSLEEHPTSHYSLTLETYLDFTVIGPGDFDKSNHYTLPVFSVNADKHEWRQDTRRLAQTVGACADETDKKAKGLQSDLGILLMRTVLTSWKQFQEKHIETGELIINSVGHAYHMDESKAADTTINIVAKNSPGDKIKRLVSINERASPCNGKEHETLSDNI